jgi:HD-GYP domain-containing protein (c-di-GMP phosphodiesterase class II)
MSGLPRAAQFFWVVIVLAGGFAALRAGLDARSLPIDWAAVALFGVAGAIAYSFRIHMPLARERQGEWTSVAMAVNVAAAMALPVPAAVAVVILEYLIQPILGRLVPWLGGGGSVWYKRLFNLAQIILSVVAAGTIWHTFGGQAGVIDSLTGVGTMLVALAAYYSINTGAVILIVSIIERAPVHHVWLRGYRRVLYPYIAVMVSGVLGAQLWSTAPVSVVLLLIPLSAIYYSIRRTVELEEQTIEALFDLADMMDKRDYYTHRHSLRVGEYAERLAMFLGRPADEARLLYLCGRLHDIGKCAVDNEVLLKPGPLSEDERRHIMRHTQVGGAMLAHFSLFKAGAAYVRGHHERWDGTGYPDGLQGEAIPFGARLIAVVDSYDAMTSTRPYRMALPHAEAVRRLQSGADTQWDPRLVEAFLEMWERQPAVRALARGAGGSREGGAVGTVRS